MEVPIGSSETISSGLDFSSQREPCSAEVSICRLAKGLQEAALFLGSAVGAFAVVTLKGGWKQQFEDPIPLPRGRQLVTLQDAARHIQKLPKVDQEAPEWQLRPRR
jgi:hypothetical protein